MQNIDFIILPELQAFIQPLKKEEFDQLKANIERDGEVRDPLIIWAKPTGEKVLIDGHNRHTVIQQLGLGNIPFKTKELAFDDIEAVKDWMIDKQLGQRNLTDEQKSYLRGLQYNREKNKHGGRDFWSGQNDHSKNKKTVEVLAEQHRVSEKTIQRDEKFAQAIDEIGKFDPELKNAILNKEIVVSKEMLYKVFDAGAIKNFAVRLQNEKTPQQAFDDIFPEAQGSSALNKPHAINRTPREEKEVKQNLLKHIQISKEEVDEILDILDDSQKIKVLAYLQRTAPAPEGYEGLHKAHQEAIKHVQNLVQKKNSLQEQIEKLEGDLEFTKNANTEWQDSYEQLQAENEKIKVLLQRTAPAPEGYEGLHKAHQELLSKHQEAMVNVNFFKKLSEERFVKNAWLKEEVNKLKAQLEAQEPADKPKAQRNTLSVYDLNFLTEKGINVWRHADNKTDVDKYENERWERKLFGKSENEAKKYLKEKIESKNNNIILW
jgi:ParB-like chromosome segregation protein Spo0J